MAKRVVILLGQPIYNEDGAAGEAITPGMLVQGVTTLTKFNTAGGPAARNVACERDEMAKDFDQDYQNGDTVKVASCFPGMHVNMLIASGVSVTEGAFVEPGAVAGTVRAYASGTRIGRALETKTASSTSRLRVEIY
jgi:acetyltransferase-like isoleucine patch superfamily enzyme